ncbi:replication initiation protein [Helicobacter suis]|uniref:replication initiation protein n=1 Tax=Helicobacter suis TaxID=104628 RepID=UPI00248F9C3D|nr:replication initiation protein [Helicobacter suis]
MEQLSTLQTLINAETDNTFKEMLRQEKADCLKDLKMLVSLMSVLPGDQQDRTENIIQENTGVNNNIQKNIIANNTIQENTIADNNRQENTIQDIPIEQAKSSQQIQENQVSIPQEAKSIQHQELQGIIPTQQDQNISHPVISEKYIAFHNDVNSVNLGKLSALETNLLFAIFNKLKDRQDELLVFDLDEIETMVHAVKINHSILSGVVKRLWKNIRVANFWILYPRAEENIMLFRKFRINYHDTQKTQVKSMEIQVNMPYFGYLLNFLNANFTSFELLEFQNIRGKYAKTLYRLLKQWKSVGVPPRMEWGKFRELMGILRDYQVGEIEMHILKPAIQELKKLPQFESLCYEKLKTKGMGNRITHIQFYFQPTTKTSKDKEQAKRDLKTIAWKIKSQQVIEQIKRSKKQRAEQAKQEDSVMEILGAAFSKPQDPSIVLVIDSIHPTLKGYNFLAKFYQNGQQIDERSATLANKEILLESFARAGYQRIDLAQQSQQVDQTPQQPPDLNPKDDLTDYIGRNLYMSKNGVPASLKIKDIARLKNGTIQVEVKDVDKPRKSLNPFKFENAAHFKNWFRKFAE